MILFAVCVRSLFVSWCWLFVVSRLLRVLCWLVGVCCVV